MATCRWLTCRQKKTLSQKVLAAALSPFNPFSPSPKVYVTKVVPIDKPLAGDVTLGLPDEEDSVRYLSFAEPLLGAVCRFDLCLGLDSDPEPVQGARSESLTSMGRFPIITVAFPLP